MLHQLDAAWLSRPWDEVRLPLHPFAPVETRVQKKGANVRPLTFVPRRARVPVSTGSPGQDIRGALPRRRARRARVHRRGQARVLPPRSVQAMARRAGIASAVVPDQARRDFARRRRARERRERRRFVFPHRSIRAPAPARGESRVDPVRARGAPSRTPRSSRRARLGERPGEFIFLFSYGQLV